MAVDDALKAASIERRIELVGEVQVVAAVGDKDAKLAPVGRVGFGSLAVELYHRVSAKRPDASCATSAIARLQ